MHCSESPELVELCTNCTKEDCPDNGCAEYYALKRQQSQKNRSRYHAKEPKPATEAPVECSVETLRRVNLAIEALEALLNDPQSDAFLTGRGIANKLLEHMKRIRFNRCQNMIDWNLIVERMKE